VAVTSMANSSIRDFQKFNNMSPITNGLLSRLSIWLSLGVVVAGLTRAAVAVAAAIEQMLVLLVGAVVLKAFLVWRVVFIR